MVTNRVQNRRVENARAPGGEEPAEPLAPYPGPERRDARLAQVARALGGEVVRYGTSVQGRPLLAARLPARRPQGDPRNDGTPPPRLLLCGGIHGLEYLSCMVVLGYLDALAAALAPRGPDHDEPPAARTLRALHARTELWAIPCVNPDGYARVWEADGVGSLALLRPNAHGVDLNRNFPLPGGARRRRLPGAGSPTPGAATYAGPAPLSEPETAALDALAREQRFAAALSGHTFLGRLIPARVTDRAAFGNYAHLCRTFARAQPRWRYGRLASRWLDTFTGELEDHLHHVYGAWAVCLESFSPWASLRQHLRAPSRFWRFNPLDPAPWIANDVPGVAAFFATVAGVPEE